MGLSALGNKSMYEDFSKRIRVSEEDDKYIDNIKGKRTKARTLKEIIEFYRNHMDEEYEDDGEIKKKLNDIERDVEQAIENSRE